MTDSNESAEPQWVGRFLDALRAGRSVRAAVADAGVACSTIYDRRKRDPEFSCAWAMCLGGEDRKRRRRSPRPKGSARLDLFFAKLVETSDVSVAAAAAGFTPSTIYKRRREDQQFARRWYAALAEGYDNLEMEVLARLLVGESTNPESDAARGRKFDTAAALRCLAAHREATAREKGRHTLAQEVATIESLNAKIDAMRLRRDTNRRVIAKAFAAVEARTGQGAGGRPAERG